MLFNRKKLLFIRGHENDLFPLPLVYRRLIVNPVIRCLACYQCPLYFGGYYVIQVAQSFVRPSMLWLKMFITSKVFLLVNVWYSRYAVSDGKAQ